MAAAYGLLQRVTLVARSTLPSSYVTVACAIHLPPAGQVGGVVMNAPAALTRLSIVWSLCFGTVFVPGGYPGGNDGAATKLAP